MIEIISEFEVSKPNFKKINGILKIQNISNHDSNFEDYS
jgi:hypothetical protein